MHSVLDAMQILSRHAFQGAMVDIPKLRSIMDDSNFDATIWDLVARDVLCVHRYDSACDDSPELCSQYLLDDQMTYYHTVSIRI